MALALIIVKFASLFIIGFSEGMKKGSSSDIRTEQIINYTYHVQDLILTRIDIPVNFRPPIFYSRTFVSFFFWYEKRNNSRTQSYDAIWFCSPSCLIFSSFCCPKECMISIMRSGLVLGMLLNITCIVMSALELDSDLTSAFSAADSIPQDIGLPLDQADPISVTQPTSFLDQIQLSEDSELFPPEKSGLMSPAFGANELSYGTGDSFLSQPTSLLDESALSGVPESYIDDGSSSLFEDDVNSTSDEANLGSVSDHTLFDDSFELADCAMSDPLASKGKKSRHRRLENSGSCKSPTTTPPSSAEPPGGEGDDETFQLPNMRTLLNDPYFLMRFSAARENDDHNSYCYLFTEGILPWGVCSSGKPEDQRSISGKLHVTTVGFFDAYELDHCTLGT